MVAVRPPRGETFGDLAANFAAAYGLAADDWQREVLDEWLGQFRGSYAALTCGIAVPRQNGKNALLEIRELYGAVGLGEKILHTAHEVKTAQKHFRRLKYFFGNQAGDPAAKFPELNALVEQIRSVNGQEAIFLKNGGSIELVARSKNSGRGFTVDVLVMDEAQELSDDALEALMPTTSSAPLGNPQWLYAGTPPGPNAMGEVFTRVRREALDGDSARLSWLEWSPPEGVPLNLDDKALWRRVNPGVAAGRLQLAVIEGERKRFSDLGFARERLGQWARVEGAGQALPVKAWDAAAVDVSVAPPEGRLVVGVKFSADGALAGLAVATRPADPLVPVRVDAIRLASMGEGTGWLVDWVLERQDRITQIVVDGKGSAQAFVDVLADAGFQTRRKVSRESSRRIRVPGVADVVSAHAAFLDAVRAGAVQHGRSEMLDAQVADATKRRIGRDGGFAWMPISDSGNTTLLDAVTFAFWGARTVTRRAAGKKQKVVIA